MINKISIIIPVFNSEKTILKTMLSVKNQTYSNFEVLVINDGSTDSSLDIIKDFCSNDNRFKFFDIKNQGVSNARNVGLDNAKGNYIVFLDSDDTLDNDYFENIIKDIKDYDMIVYSIRTNNGVSEKEISNSLEIDDSIGKIQFVEELTNSRLFANSTNKVFLKDKIKDIRFDTSTNLGEDYEFVLHYFINITKFKYYKKAFYNYDLTTGNLGFKNKKNTYELKSKGNLRMLEFYKLYNGDLNVVYREFVKAFVLDMMMFMTSSNITKKDMIINQKHCMSIFDLTSIQTKFKYKLIIYIFNSRCFLLVKVFSYLIKYLNIMIKRINYGL